MVARSRLNAAQAIAMGSGYEGQAQDTAAAPANPLGFLDPWDLMARRVMGGEATKSQVVYQIARRLSQGGIHPSRVIFRPVVQSIMQDPCVNGTYNLQFQFPTLTIVNGISAQLYEGDATDHLAKYTLRINAGADGGTIIGTIGAPTRLCALENIPQQDGGTPRLIQPCATTAVNPWTATLVGANVVGQNNVVVINLYGVGCWVPEGQIQ